MSYEQKKNELLENSKKLNEAINSVIKSDPNKLVINSSDRSKINELQKASSVIVEKLKKDEFEIAIVGQEDSGKSSLLNALIKTDIFPSASGRTTYTSTKLVSGKEDKAEVTLYTQNEFDEIFKARLKSIGIEGDYLLDGISLEDFENEFKELSNQKQTDAKHNNLYNDTKEIIELKDKLSPLLQFKGGQTLSFEGANLQEFREYVTGHVSDKSKPRITKKVVIYSSQLQAMPSSVIYDVPGFNSPTRLHKEQTENMLKQADSIIFITDVSSPNLKDNELDLLSKGEDSYGVSLKDKLFVFGNKYDKANNEKEALSNEQKFRNDILHEKTIGDEKRVFVGSAGKYLVDNNIGNIKIDNLPNWAKSNIDEFRKMIEDYYHNDRFDVLEKRIKTLQRQTLDIFVKIKNSISLPNHISKRSLELEISSKAEKNIRRQLEANLNQIKVDLKQEFLDKKYFSDGFANEVPNYFSEIDMSYIDQFIPKYEDNFDSINRTIREDYLHNKFLADFSELVKQIVDDKADEVHERVFTAFVSAIRDNERIREMAEDVFVFEQQSGKFDYLFERFGRKMLDLIIYNPIMGSKREEDYKKYKDEFLYLDSRYKKDGRILNMVISGQDKPLVQSNGLERFKRDFFNALETRLTQSSKDFAETCENSLFPQLEELAKQENSFDDKELFGNRKGNYSREDVLEEINRDINNFKTVLIEAVIPILDLETVFIKRVEKEIRVLISRLDSEEMNKFILDSIEIYNEKEFAEIDEKVADYTRKKEILTEVEKFLKEYKK